MTKKEVDTLLKMIVKVRDIDKIVDYLLDIRNDINPEINQAPITIGI